MVMDSPAKVSAAIEALSLMGEVPKKLIISQQDWELLLSCYPKSQGVNIITFHLDYGIVEIVSY